MDNLKAEPFKHSSAARKAAAIIQKLYGITIKHPHIWRQEL